MVFPAVFFLYLFNNSQRKLRGHRNTKFLVDFKIADGKYKNLNLLLALVEISFVLVILIVGKNNVLQLLCLSWIFYLSVWKETNDFGTRETRRLAAIFNYCGPSVGY